MEFQALVLGAVEDLDRLAPDQLARVCSLVERYEEIAQRAPTEVGELRALPSKAGAAAWRRLLVGGLRASGALKKAAVHPAIDLESHLLVRDASVRLNRATNALIAVSAERVEARR